MKRNISLFLIFILLFVLSGCKSINDTAYKFFLSFSNKGNAIADFNSVNRFYRSQLSGTDAEDYDTLLLGYSKHEKNILGLKSDLNRISELSQLITLDYPELFWVTNTGLYYSDSTFWLLFSSGPLYSPNYRYSVNEILDFQVALRNISDDISDYYQYSSDYEKALAAYDYIINNTEYDEETANAIINGENYDITKDSSQCVISALLEGKSVCAGYSAAYQYLLGSMGIEAAGIIGKIDDSSSSFDHEWNILKLDNNYYYTDITWGEMNDTNSVIEYGYFCLNSSEMLSTHLVSDKQYFPNTSSVKCNYFYRNNRYYYHFDLSSINNDMINAAINEVNSICFKFENIKDYNRFTNGLLNDENDEILQVFNNMHAVNSKLLINKTSFISSPDIKTIKIFLEYKN